MQWTPLCKLSKIWYSSTIKSFLNIGRSTASLTNDRCSNEPLKKDSFVQKPDIAHVKPRFEDWRLIKAQALVTGKVTVTENKLREEFGFKNVSLKIKYKTWYGKFWI